MKTNNYQFELMYQGQDHKDIIYNEAILKIDAMINLNIISFLESPPQFMFYGEKYIISHGEHRNKICYFAHESKAVQYILPHNNMIIYLMSDDCFFKFIDNQWRKTEFTQEPRFIGINERFTLSEPQDYYYLYLENSTILSFEIPKSFALVIKQNSENIFALTWPPNILWPNKIPVLLTAQTNAIDLFRFHKLAGSDHFLAELISQNYQY